MTTPNYSFGHVEPWWDDSFKDLQYQYFPIKNTHDEDRWRAEGYQHVTLNGAIVTMKSLLLDMPSYAEPFLTLFDWQHVTLAFYRQKTLDLFPLHSDNYVSYRKIFGVDDPDKIWRCVVFLEDWKSGHYFEVDGVSRLNWRRGDYCRWRNDTPHFAANIGVEPRYTLQITGHV